MTHHLLRSGGLFLSLLILSGCKQAPPDARKAELAESIQRAVDRHDVPTINVGDAKSLFTHAESQNPLFVDTRAAAEYEVSHIPGAILWPRNGSFPPTAISEAATQNRPIILYCSIGERSGSAGDELLELSTEGANRQIYNMAGGLFLWAEDGGPLIKSDGSAAKVVHPYDDKWGKLLKPELRAPLD